MNCEIAVFGDKKPFGYVDNDGSYQGYDIELGNQLAQDLGVKVKYVSVDAANRAEYLISNKVDITLANFTVDLMNVRNKLIFPCLT